MADRFRKPLTVLDMEYGDEVWVYGNNRLLRSMKITFDRESTERIRMGRACAKCLAVFERAWPEKCPECGAPIRARQLEFFQREYAEERLGGFSISEEIERLNREGHRMRQEAGEADASVLITSEEGDVMADEVKLPLPSGHPQAGYLPPDLSLRDGVEEQGDDKKEYDKQVKEREDAAKAIAEHEDKVRREEIKAEEKAAKEAEKEAAKEPAKK